jgi:hypothetical protein
MTDSNLTQLAYVAESTWGTTPGSPAMRGIRYTGENIDFNIENTESQEIVTDRQTTDLIQTGARAVGGYNFEVSYKEHDEFFESALMSVWDKTPEKDNNGTADSAITGVTDSSDTFAVDAGGTAFVAGHLVKATGFTNNNNNLLFRVASSTSTTIVGSSLSLTDEAAPPGTARLKVVGFQGTSGDITATSTGLASTTLNFTTLGLNLYDWVKIGGSAAGDKFATAVLNTWCRITAIAQHSITLDNRPSGWTTDSGSGKTIKVWIGDSLSNGVTMKSFTVEKGFLGQTVPNYLPFAGCVVDTCNFSIEAGSPLSGSFNFLGKSASAASTTPLDASITPSYAGKIMNSVSDVGRLTLNGSDVGSPNYVQSITLQLSNSLYDKTAVANLGLVGVGIGRFRLTGNVTVYFGNATYWDLLVANSLVSMNSVFVKDNQAYMLQVPSLKFSSGTPQAAGGDQSVVMNADFTAIKDTVSGKTFIMNRFEYAE